MLSLILFWSVALAFGLGHGLLIRSAWRMQRAGDGPAGLGWTLVTAVASLVLLMAVYTAI